MKTKPGAPILGFGQTLLENRNFHLESGKTYRLISFLGIHVVYDLSRSPGDRVVKLDGLCTRCRVPTYEPLRMDDVYNLVLPNFLAKGGDGYQMIKEEVLQHNSGEHKCLFFPTSQRYSGTAVLVRRGELVMTPRQRGQNADPDPYANSCLSVRTCASSLTAHMPIHPSPGKTHFLNQKCFKTLLCTYKHWFEL